MQYYTSLLLWPAKFMQPGTISMRGTVLYWASSCISKIIDPIYMQYI